MVSIAPVSKSGLSGYHSLEPVPAAMNGVPYFVRPSRDLQPASGANARLPEIDANASPEEKNLYGMAVDLSGGYLRAMPLRLGLMLRAAGSPAMLENFVFAGQPASVQTDGTTVLVNVGSEANGSAGQVTMKNGYVETKKGTLDSDPSTLQSAIRHASLALCLGVAREKKMPYAVDALIRLQHYAADN